MPARIHPLSNPGLRQWDRVALDRPTHTAGLVLKGGHAVLQMRMAQEKFGWLFGTACPRLQPREQIGCAVEMAVEFHDRSSRVAIGASLLFPVETLGGQKVTDIRNAEITEQDAGSK